MVCLRKIIGSRQWAAWCSDGTPAKEKAGRYAALDTVQHSGKQQHFNQLAQAVDEIGPYQGNVAATRRSWAQGNRSKVMAFIRGYAEAIDCFMTGVTVTSPIRILLRNLPQMTPELAQRSYEELLDPKYGFFRRGR